MTRKPPRNLYGRRLREARDSYGYSQTHLAIAARLDESSASPRVSRYETGENQPKFGLQDLFAAALALPTDFFRVADDTKALEMLAQYRSDEPLRVLVKIKVELGQKLSAEEALLYEGMQDDSARPRKIKIKRTSKPRDKPASEPERD